MINKKAPTVPDLDRRLISAAIRTIRPTCVPFNLSFIHAWMLSIHPSWNIGTTYIQLCWACFHHFGASITVESIPFELHRFVTSFTVVYVGNGSMSFVQDCVIMTGNNCKEIINNTRQRAGMREKHIYNPLYRGREGFLDMCANEKFFT